MIRKRGLLLGYLALAGLPLIAGGLWLASGRETLTKPSRSVTVQVQDELFGGVNTEVRSVRGPILGYYIGLDLVGIVLLAALATAMTLWWISRRRRRPAGGVEGGLQHE